MSTQIIHTDKAPAAVGPYSQAVRLDSLVYTAGQIAIDPAVGKLIDGDVEAQTHQVLKNLKAILEAGGSSLEKVLKATVFVKDMNLFGRINVVYGEYFNPEFAPARELVQVSELPKFVNIEISAIASI